jgi:hypothetical protein
MEPKIKSFWARPEGKTGILALLGIGVATWYFIVPFIVSMLANTALAIVLAAVVGGLIYAITSKQVRTVVWYMFKSAMRWVTGIVVNIDPIGIMKTYVEDMTSKREDMGEQISKLDAEIVKSNRVISAKTKEIQEQLQQAEIAKRQNKQGAMTVSTRQAGRLQDFLNRIKPMVAKMEAVKAILIKLYENSEFAIDDLKSEIQIRELEYETVKKGYSALRSAMSIFKGDPDKKAVFEQAMELVENNISFKAAEMDRFIRETQSIVSKIDIENEAFNEDGLKMLEEMGNRSLQIMLAPIGKEIELLPAEKSASIENDKFGEIFSDKLS